jgi:hypothetical protein
VIEAMTSRERTGSLSWKRRPSRRRKVQVLPSWLTSSASTIWPLRLELVVEAVQRVPHLARRRSGQRTACPRSGRSFARLACGTKRSVRAAAPCDRAGVENAPDAAPTPAAAPAFRKVLRSIIVFPLPGRSCPLARQPAPFLCGTPAYPGRDPHPARPALHATCQPG